LRPILKKLRYIVFFLAAMLLSQTMTAATSLISNDPNWLGGKATFNTTEGNDFWLTFMNNGMFDASKAENKNKPFEMKVLVSAREAMSVKIDVGTTNIYTLELNAGETQIYTIDRDIYAKSIYLFTSESTQAGYKGVHVYAAQKDKDKFFSCFTYNRTGDIADSYREASLILPTQSLGKEYYIQNSPEDNFSSQFAIVATENGTVVQFTPSDTTFAGQVPEYAPYTVTMNKGDAYLVASKTKKEGVGTYELDLSGSFICANKPIAVFNGNQQTSIPISVTKARNFATEQSIPIAQWGKEFYITKLERTKINYFRITAAYDNTTITVKTENNTTGATLTLAEKGQSTSIDADYIVGVDANEFVITSDHPVILYSYTSSAHDNDENVTVDGRNIKVLWGNSANAMMPAWSHRAKKMNFFTHELDPEKVLGKTPPQEFYVYLVTKTSDANKVTVDGATVTFKPFAANPSMSYAHVEVSNTTAYHTVETTGEGFVGLVYALTHAQGYYTALGFTPDPFGDSLFINNQEALMKPESYDMDSLDGHGWYQRQWGEWVEGHERLDTAVVCDSSFVQWTLETHPERAAKTIDWNLYDVTDGARTSVENDDFPKQDVTPTGTKHPFRYQFILPEEDNPKTRHQFFDYELEIIVHRDQILCGEEELDTFRCVTRVTRIFNDTSWRAICLGDTLLFFNDSLYDQGDLTKYKAGEKKETRFVATKDGTPQDWLWNVTPGSYSYTRRYESQFGCDSLVTLELFVCDTFRFFDTIHLCSNQDTMYMGTNYKGIDYTGPHSGKEVSKSGTYYNRYKTEDCGCLKDKNKDKYLDVKGNKFKGCDSIYQLDIVLHRSYDTLTVDTMDYHQPRWQDSVYHWPIERDGVTRDSLITKYNPGMKWDDKAQAWVGHFGDTLRTKTCSECNGGNPKGCDSINSLHLIIPPTYYFDTTITWCRLSYDWNRHDTIRRDFQWKGHHGNIIYPQDGIYYDSCVSRYKADSIYRLELIYSKAKIPHYDLVDTTICMDTVNTKFQWISHDGVFQIDTIPVNQWGEFYYVDDTTRCDTIYALHITIIKTFYHEDEQLISLEEKFKWYADGKTYAGPKATGSDIDVVVNKPLSEFIYEQPTDPVNGVTCINTYKLILHMGEVYRDTIHDRYVCEEETEYHWIEDRPQYYVDGQPFERKTITSFPARGERRVYEDRYETILGFDSIFYLDLYRAPAHDSTDVLRTCQAPGATFDWPGHGAGHTIYDAEGKKVTSIPAERHGDYWYIDSLTTKGYGCDSIWHLHLFVDSVYHSDSTYKTCQFTEDYAFPYQDPNAVFDKNGNKVKPIPTDHVGDYTYYAKYKTVHGCDSTFELTLHIDTVYKVAVTVTDTAMCDKDSIVFVDRTIYGSNSPNKPADVAPENVVTIPADKDSVIVALKGSVRSSLGCDSAVEYSLTVFKTYSDTTYLRLCQPSEGRDSFYVWSDHDTVWDVHNQRFIPADSIPRFVKGDTTYLYIDSLRTKFCTLCNEGRGGCDSLFFLYLTIDSTYHFYDTAHICENEYHTWQNIRFIGDSLPQADRLPKDSVLAPGTYHMRVRYDALHTCDSIYYLELYVHPVYHTKDTVHVCDSEREHTFFFSDTWGTTYSDPISFAPHPSVFEEDTATTHYDVRYETREHLLKSIDGCDSLVTLTLAIHPTYRFIARGKGCFGDIVEWRGNSYSRSGMYYDSLKTKNWDCDSVFVLEFLIKPVSIIPITDTICESESYYHRDTLWGAHGDFSVFEEMIWEPGNPRPRPNIDVHIKAYDGVCDSIIYRYNITVCDTFVFRTAATVCSGVAYHSDELNHTWEKSVFEYDITDQEKKPFDTVFIDPLLTVKGCDSLYILNAHVLPSYRHVEYDTICGNASLLWRDTLLHDLDYGSYIVHDSNYTALYGCDSIYELRLYVYPKYLVEEYATICADETYSWRAHFIEHASPGDSLVYDSIETIYHCDSIFHLYLHVNDTTNTVRYDTICIGDTLTITETGHMYTVPGEYKDTTLNDEGCYHFIYTHLADIPPTVPTIWAEDPMCQSEAAFDLFYTYTSHFPIAYSLYFDSVGLSMGFEDMEDVAITEYTDPMVITVPIPYRDDDPTKYPRPDNYSVRLVLDNGICQHKETDCYRDSTFMMSYPKWLTEQRHGDVIALLNERYNGGYTWSSYQWYQGDKMLVGQTNPYLYIPTGLEVGEQYHVRLTREGESQSFPTCPITVGYAPLNDYAPTMGYLDVVPTCVVPGHPYVTIMSRHDGHYRITDSSGSSVASGDFQTDATVVQVPSVSGMYIVQLWSEQTQEEPYRAIKIVVRDVCETCGTSF